MTSDNKSKVQTSRVSNFPLCRISNKVILREKILIHQTVEVKFYFFVNNNIKIMAVCVCVCVCVLRFKFSYAKKTPACTSATWLLWQQ